MEVAETLTDGGKTIIVGNTNALNNGFNKETLDALNARFDTKDIKTRKDLYSGKILSYIEGYKVIERLNSVFKGSWSFQILSKEVIENVILIEGRLTINGINKEQFGAQKISFGPPILKEVSQPENPDAPKKRGRKKKVLVPSNIPINLGYDMKAATTDCIKKCASLFGIGLYLYGEDEVLEVASHSEPIVALEEKPKNATTAQLQAIKKMLKKYKKGESDNFNDYICLKYNIKNIEDLSYENAVKEMKELNNLSNSGSEPNPFE